MTDDVKRLWRRHRKVAAFAVLGVILGAALTAGAQLVMHSTLLGLTDTSNEGEVIAIEGPTLPESRPLRLRIPDVGIDTSFEDESLGLTANNAPEVPEGYDSVGWYEHGPTPGEPGPAVILGHVDSVDGPAVFYPLRQLEEGDSVYVDREDGTTAEFVVTAFESPSQASFPFDRVYGDIDHAGLRLITCSGTFDHGEQRYSHNLIVYAKLVDSE